MSPKVSRRIPALALAAAALYTVGVVLHAFSAHFPGSILGPAEALRWIAIVLLGVDAIRRRTLTPWIFVALVAGIEVGFDAPAFAVRMHVLSDVFLRLIKSIVAPLILTTLVVGIAGHGDLRGVGRMGLKAIVYFEVVTTLALVIGLFAINVSRAGVGLVIPGAASAALTASAPPAHALGRFPPAHLPRKPGQEHR